MKQYNGARCWLESLPFLPQPALAALLRRSLQTLVWTWTRGLRANIARERLEEHRLGGCPTLIFPSLPFERIHLTLLQSLTLILILLHRSLQV